MSQESMSTVPTVADSLVALLWQLVARPSRAGEDDCAPVMQVIADWLEPQGIVPVWLRDATGRPLGLCGEIVGARPCPTYLLDATVDTAPYGDPAAWTTPPDRPSIADGWLYGRGSADSKAGIAVFCHVLADLSRRRDGLAGKVGFVFDAEEHIGTFAGIRRYMEQRDASAGRIAGVMIGYPGNDRLVVGARGFLRVRLHLHGLAAHSGASGGNGINAIERARELLRLLAEVTLPAGSTAFPLGPRITATGIDGGGSFSLVPDRCVLELDCRLTPDFPDAAARALIQDLCARLDATAAVPPIDIEWLPGWPAYRLATDDPMVLALAAAGREAFGHDLPQAVVGPSSIANYLATLGIAATAGLGVNYRNIHAPDEAVELATLEPTRRTYLTALQRLLR